jgi:hypothetical protein
MDNETDSRSPKAENKRIVDKRGSRVNLADYKSGIFATKSQGATLGAKMDVHNLTDQYYSGSDGDQDRLKCPAALPE